jgi:hypothetical protein
MELPNEVVTTLHFLESFAHYSGITRKALAAHIPEPILDQYQTLSTS